jgi:GH18 family chitinase
MKIVTRILIGVLLIWGLLILLSTLSHAQYQIGMYYQSWDYTNNPPKGQIQNMNLKGLTYVVHIAGGGGTDFKTTSPYFPGDSNAILHNSINNVVTDDISTKLTTSVHTVGAKALLCLGCPNGVDGSIILSDSVKTQTMVNAAVAFAKYHNYDGLDIDWEDYNPVASQLAMFVRILRRTLDANYGPGIAWLTCAQMHGEASMFPSWMQNYFTYFGIQSYDLTNNNDNVTGYNDPIYPPSKATSSSLWGWQDSWYGVWNAYGDAPIPHGGPRQYIAAGWNPNKLIIGASQAGYLYENATAPGQSQSGLNRRQINYNFARLAQINGGKRTYDTTSKVPWIGGTATTNFGDDWYDGNTTKGTKFYITYDDTISYQAKVAYIKANSYAGMFMYEAGIDWDGTNYLTLVQSAVRAFKNQVIIPPVIPPIDTTGNFTRMIAREDSIQFALGEKSVNCPPFPDTAAILQKGILQGESEYVLIGTPIYLKGQ